MAGLIRFVARNLHLQPETRPKRIELGFATGTPMEVVATDGAGEIARLPLRQMAHWLFMNRYRWVPGSQAIYVRE